MAETTDHTLSDDLQARLDAATVAKAEADARSAVVQADKAAADARTAQITALVPDLSKVKDSTLDVKGGPALFSTKLTYRALAKAAGDVARDVADDTKNLRVLVTTEADLASADAGYTDVKTGLDELKVVATALLSPLRPPKLGDGHELMAAAWLSNVSFFASPILPAATAIAGALPSVLSLLSAQRSVTTSAAAMDDLAAAAAVAGALRRAKAAAAVLLDDFRLLPKDSEIYRAAADVAELREQLVAEKLRLVGDADSTARGGSIDTVVTAIDAFTAAMRTVPPNGRRSPLAAAALHEELHRADGFSRVLLIKAQPGEAQQVTQNRPLGFKDQFTTMVDVNLLYVLINTADSTVLGAGTATAVAKAYGKIGADFTVKTD